MNVKELHDKYDQSVWLDDIRRHLLQSGEFERLVRDDGIRGVTSNPSIFEKAITGSTDYDAPLERYEESKDETASTIYEHLAIEDIQQAAVFLLRSTTNRIDATATSAWRSRPTSRATPERPSPRRRVSGSASGAARI